MKCVSLQSKAVVCWRGFLLSFLLWGLCVRRAVQAAGSLLLAWFCFLVMILPGSSLCFCYTCTRLLFVLIRWMLTLSQTLGLPNHCCLFVPHRPLQPCFVVAVSAYKLFLQIAGFASGIASDGSPAWSLVPFILVHGWNRFVLCLNLSSSFEPLVLHREVVFRAWSAPTWLAALCSTRLYPPFYCWSFFVTLRPPHVG